MTRPLRYSGWLSALLLVLSAPAQAYWAKLDVSNLTHQRIRIINTSERDLRCDVRAFNDKMFIDIRQGTDSPNVEVIPGLKRTDLSLHCEPIKQAARLTPWRYIRHTTPLYRSFVFR